ncbi:peptidoglycan-associated lipoprotein Pal [Methylococcus geothermalis]|uniref:Peptidoglycan-associated lipoprotein n=2 Tax=Methylococcus geothermalis TaxID=2681310 RepID=A0A858QC33_9GAMM|nr:peptidoglycan-associated lipoprotein Pal [Methylococcus geothermalis]
MRTGLVILMSASLLMAGCSKTEEVKPDDAAGVGLEGGGPGGPQIGKYGAGGGAGKAYGGTGGAYGGKGGAYGGAGDPALNDPSSPLSKRVVYFGYDSSEVLPEYVSVINAHAAYLASHPNVTVTLEGHCDERGSPEYNIALGEQRARSVANTMHFQGVGDGQMQIVSFGEEKPADSGSGESSWSRNRRVEIVYPGN